MLGISVCVCVCVCACIFCDRDNVLLATADYS